MVLYIKYMVSLRCKTKVKTELNNLGLQFSDVESGAVDMDEEITEEQRKQLKTKLHRAGMELLDDKNSILIEKVITTITKMIFTSGEVQDVVYADYLSQKLDFDFVEMSSIFSEVKGITIQQFIMVSKIERVKELLLYDVLTVKEIAAKLNYKSVPGLSSEFVKVTGLSLKFFKNLKQKRKLHPDKKEK